MTALPLDSLTVGIKCLHTPDIEELSLALHHGLRCNYVEVLSEVVECPDLTKDPYALPTQGICGNAKIIDVGGPAYFIPKIDTSKLYDLKDMMQIAGLSSGLISGAAIAPIPFKGSTCEAIINMGYNGSCVKQKSKAVIIKDKGVELEKIPDSETKFSLLANLFASEGLPGEVIRIFVRTRLGEESFPESIKNVLLKSFPDHMIGLGGVFYSRAGMVKHTAIKPLCVDPPTNFNDNEELANCMEFFSFPPPLVSTGVIISKDFEDLNFRLKHFHSYGPFGAGHYHIDDVPKYAEYEGYFTIADTAYRVDQPDLVWDY